MIGKSHKRGRIATAIALTVSVAACAAQPALSFDGRSPDARDAGRQASDARGATLTDARSPDTREAGERAGSSPLVDGRSPDARDAGFRPVAPATAVSPDRFHWGDFGIGVGVAITSLLLLAGLAAGALTVRHRRVERTRPATT